MGYSTENLVNHQLLKWIASLLALVRRTNSYDFYLTEVFPTVYTLHCKHKLNVPDFPRMSDSTSLEEIQLKTSYDGQLKICFLSYLCVQFWVDADLRVLTFFTQMKLNEADTTMTLWAGKNMSWRLKTIFQKLWSVQSLKSNTYG